VLTTRYQEAALVEFYGRVPATTLPDTGRPDQYDLWPRALPDRALFVRQARHAAPTAVERWYPHVGAPNDVVAYAPTSDPTVDVPVHHWQVYEVWR
jgi:hypothetical protein